MNAEAHVGSAFPEAPAGPVGGGPASGHLAALAAAIDRLEAPDLPLDEAAVLASETAPVAADAAAELEAAARLAARDDIAQTAFL